MEIMLSNVILQASISFRSLIYSVSFALINLLQYSINQDLMHVFQFKNMSCIWTNRTLHAFTMKLLQEQTHWFPKFPCTLEMYSAIFSQGAPVIIYYFDVKLQKEINEVEKLLKGFSRCSDHGIAMILSFWEVTLTPGSTSWYTFQSCLQPIP